MAAGEGGEHGGDVRAQEAGEGESSGALGQEGGEELDSSGGANREGGSGEDDGRRRAHGLGRWKERREARGGPAKAGHNVAVGDIREGGGDGRQVARRSEESQPSGRKDGEKRGEMGKKGYDMQGGSCL